MNRKALKIGAMAVLCSMAVSAQTLLSPNKQLKMDFSIENGRPTYTLQYKGKTVIAPSHLGLELKGESQRRDFNDLGEKNEDTPYSLMTGFCVADTACSTFDETWTPVWGEEASIRNHYNELAVTVRQKNTDREMVLRFRLFDDGLGFRYEFPVQKRLRHFMLDEELTEFQLAGDHKAFWIPADYDTNEYPISTSKLSEVPRLIDEVLKERLVCKSPTPNLAVQTPLMLKSDDGLYINIHEAALVNYAAMHLNLDAQTFLMSTP